uniref:Endonuclease/exonuclease/phosphatase domain-containing protein n=1 Tax=Pristionchus pacificus TaxID=54126 RepID=A0A8R1UWG3_PRIPA
MGKTTLENILEELKIDREERRKERKALEESIRGIQVQFTKTLSDRVKTLEKTFETFAENTNKSITVLGQLIGRVLDSQSSSISNIPAMKASFVSTMTNSHMINEKATRAVLIGFAEKQTPEETDLADLKTNNKDRDHFIAVARQKQACRLSGSVHAFVRRDLTSEELDVDRSLREAGKRNAEAGQLEYVVRDLGVVRLSNPRPLPPRSQQALDRAIAAQSAAPTSSSLPPALSSLTTLSHPAPSHPRSQSSSSFGRGRGRGGGGGNGGGRASSRQSRPLVSSPSNLRSNHSKSEERSCLRGPLHDVSLRLSSPSTMSSSVCPPKANKGKKAKKVEKAVCSVMGAMYDTSQFAHSKLPIQCDSISFCLLNTRSIGYKIPMLEDFINTFAYAVVGVTETWISSHNVNDGMLSLSGQYTVYRADRDESGGGVALLIRSDFPSTLSFARSFSPYCQSIAAITHFGDTQFLICLVYRSPSCDLAIRNQTHPPNILLSLVRSLSLTQIVSAPTRGNNILDIVLSSHPNLLQNCRVLPPLPKLDHSLVTFHLSTTTPRAKVKLLRDFRKVSWDRVNYQLSCINWDITLSTCDQSPDGIYESLTTFIHDIMDENIPFRKLAQKPNLLSHKSLRLLRKLRTLSQADRLKDHSVPIPPFIDATGSHFVSDQSKADHISKHFSKCFNYQTYPIPAQPPPIAGPTIDFVPFSPMVILKTLLKLPNRNSTSPDGIPWIQSFLSEKNHPSCKISVLATDLPTLLISVLATDLPIRDEIRDLGVTYSNRLCFTKYIKDIIGKASTRCSFIHRSFQSQSITIFSKLFSTYVRPLLEYCSELWNPCTVTHIARIEKVQRRFSGIVFSRCGLPPTPYHDRLKIMNLPSLYERRTRIDLLRSRGHRLKLSPFRTSSNRYCSFLPNRIIVFWNSLEDSIFSNSSPEKKEKLASLCPQASSDKLLCPMRKYSK